MYKYKKYKKAMTRKDQEDWDDLYIYIQKILGYEKNQHLPKYIALRLKGLSQGKYMPNNNIESKKACYSFEVIRYTFMACSPKIQEALKNNKFEDEIHKFNYILKIVEKNLDDMSDRVAKRNSEIV